jgi:hypothetical protein
VDVDVVDGGNTVSHSHKNGFFSGGGTGAAACLQPSFSIHIIPLQCVAIVVIEK